MRLALLNGHVTHFELSHKLSWPTRSWTATAVCKTQKQWKGSFSAPEIQTFSLCIRIKCIQTEVSAAYVIIWIDIGCYYVIISSWCCHLTQFCLNGSSVYHGICLSFLLSFISLKIPVLKNQQMLTTGSIHLTNLWGISWAFFFSFFPRKKLCSTYFPNLRTVST